MVGRMRHPAPIIHEGGISSVDAEDAPTARREALDFHE